MKLQNALKNKDHIIWDWNGTILNDVDHAVETMNGLLKKHQLDQIDKDYYKKIFEFPVKKYYDRLGFDYSIRSFEDLCHDFVDGFMGGVPSCKLFPEIEPVLHDVKGANRTQSVLSASDQENLDFMIQHFGLNDLFDHVFGIEDKFGRSKVYRGKQLIENSQIPVKNTVLIGDTLHDLEVGEELGVEVILVTHGHQCESILSRHHKNVLNIL